MPETVDVDDLMKAAAVAARRNDPAEAAGLLRRVVTLQEQSLGPHDRDLAPTLNNLGLMLERQGEMAEAERCYRRAYDIARRGVGADDPLAQVARANLVEFLQATGQLDPLRDDIPRLDLETEPPTEPVASRLAPDRAPPRLTLDESQPAVQQAPEPASPIATSAADRRRPAALAPPSLRPQPSAPSQRPPVPPVPGGIGSGRVGTLGRLKWLVAGLVLAMGVEAWLVMGRRADIEQSAPAEAPAPPPAQSPAASAPESSRAVESTPSAAAPRETPPPPTPPPPASPVPAPQAAPPQAGAIDAETRLCLTLNRDGGAWQCTPLGQNGRPDAVYFYTRVKTPRDAVIRHRWTHDGAVVQTVNLQVRANAREGFRTFSHQRVAGRTGEWEVALISADGSVVETQRFTVQE